MASDRVCTLSSLAQTFTATTVTMGDTSALKKRTKRLVLGRRHHAMVRFPHGLGQVCLEEAQQYLSSAIFPAEESPVLTLKENSVEVSNISYRELLALAMQMTTARDILWVVQEGPADSIAKLKKKLAQVPWDFFLCPGDKWAIRATSRASRVFHEGLIKESVQKQLESRGCLVVQAKDADQRLDICLESDRFRIALSISGRFLYQRRYKSSLHSVAPLKEDLAAGLVRLGWNDRTETTLHERAIQIWVPFAGSGTLAFESIFFLRKIAPEIFFGSLGAESFPCTPEASAKFARATLRRQWLAHKETRHHWHLVEMNAVQFESLKKNVAYFREKLASVGCLPPTISLEHTDIFLTKPPAVTRGDILLALFNPPYGERLGSKNDARKTYKNIGQILTQLPSDIEVRGAILVPDLDTLQTFTTALQTFQTKEHIIRQGGKKITVVTFSRQAKATATPISL